MIRFSLKGWSDTSGTSGLPRLSGPHRHPKRGNKSEQLPLHIPLACQVLFSPKEENSECCHPETSHNLVSAFTDFFLGIYIPTYMYIITKSSIGEFYSLIFSLSILQTFFIYQTYFCNSLTVQYSIVFLSAPNFIHWYPIVGPLLFFTMIISIGSNIFIPQVYVYPSLFPQDKFL